MEERTVYDSSVERLDAVNEKINLIQKKSGLTFGTDAFLLAAFTEGNGKGIAAELGGGTGIISLLLAARERFSRIYTIEVQPDYAELCSRNAALNGYSDKMISLCSDIRETGEADIGGRCDVVVSNPPYMKLTSGKRNDDDGKFTARHEVLGDIYDFCAAAARLLKFGGYFYCVYRPDRLADLISALRASRLEPKRITFVYPDAKSIPSAVLVKSRFGGASLADVTKPLFIYRDGAEVKPRVMTDDAELIYRDMSFTSFLGGRYKNGNNS